MKENVESLFEKEKNPHVRALETALDDTIDEIATGNLSAAEALGVIEIVKAKLIDRIISD